MILPQATQLPATLSFEQLRDGIRARYARILAVEVEYETSQELVRAEPELLEIVPRSRQRFAVKGEKRFRAQSGIPEPVDASLEMNSMWAFDGEVSQSYHVSSKTGSLDHGQRFSAIDRYVHSLAIFMKDDQRRLLWGDNDHYSLPFALDCAELGWKVQPTLDLLNGKACHVLEASTKQRLWIDPALDYALRFREARTPIDRRPVDEWPLSSRLALRDYQPINDHISLPWRIEHVHFLSTRMPESEWNKPSVVSVDEVTYLAVNNDVPDERFTLSFPPGTTVTDTVNQRFYRVGRNNVDINLAGPEWYLSLGRRR